MSEHKLARSIMLVVALVALLTACTAPATTTLSPGPAPSQPIDATSKPIWQEEWDQTVAAAKREGNLVIYTVGGTDIQTALRNSFKTKFGLDIEYVAGMGTLLSERILSQQRAGLYLADLYLAGPTTPTMTFKPAGALAPIKPLLLLPEVLDSNAYFDNKIPFVDKEGMYIINHAAPLANDIAINTDLVKPGEIKSYADLLDPKWKDKILLYDPTSAGPALDWFWATVTMLGADFHRQLVKQNPLITRDRRLQVEWVAKGKYHIALAPGKELVLEFERVGAPIKWVVLPAEGYIGGAPSGSIAYFDRAPHPNAAKVFVNWFLTKEGLTIWSQTTLMQTACRDVPTEFLKPGDIRDPKVRYLNSLSEEVQLKKNEMAPLAREIYGPLLK